MQWSALQLVQCHLLTVSRNHKRVSYPQTHTLSPAAHSQLGPALTLAVALRMKAGSHRRQMTCATVQT